MSTITQGIDRIPDSLGFLVLNEDGAVLGSGGELENDEVKADIFMNLIQKAAKIQMSADDRTPLKRLSIMYDNFMYVITATSGQVYICKRHHIPTEPANV
ncbi:ragulator complex protein LAMTOR4-like [Lineus longissimus]|uniref:ragulator complex protein LAMTOR4-like n=1 Tax=Lineus longissimus TaxID=88925 RepID=UPI002B4ED87E